MTAGTSDGSNLGNMGTGDRPQAPIVARPQILPAPKFSRTLDTLWSIYSKKN